MGNVCELTRLDAIAHGDHNVPLFVSLLDIVVCGNDLLEGIDSVNNGSQLAGLNEFAQEIQILNANPYRAVGVMDRKECAPFVQCSFAMRARAFGYTMLDASVKNNARLPCAREHLATASKITS